MTRLFKTRRLTRRLAIFIAITLTCSACSPVCVPSEHATSDETEYCRLANQDHRQEVANKVLYWVVLPATAIGVFALAAAGSGGGGAHHKPPPALSSPLGQASDLAAAPR